MKLLRSATPALLLATAFASLLAFPQDVSAAVTDGLRLCATTLIPALFPFFVCVSLAADLGLTAALARLFAPPLARLLHLSVSGSAALFFGVLGGYPSGAQSVASLVRSKQLSTAEADYLLLFCNNAGPAFLFGVAAPALGCPLRFCLLLWAIQLLSALTIGLLHRPKQRFSQPAVSVPAPSFSTSFIAAVRSAGESALQITFLVTAFSVLIRLLLLLTSHVLPPALLTALTGFFELSSGLSALSALAFPLRTKLTLAAFLLGFGGLCVLAQIRAVLAQAGLSGRGIGRAKLAQALLAAVLTFAAASFLPSEPVPVGSFSTPPRSLPILWLLAAIFCLVCRNLRVDNSPKMRYNVLNHQKER